MDKFGPALISWKTSLIYHSGTKDTDFKQIIRTVKKALLWLWGMDVHGQRMCSANQGTHDVIQIVKLNKINIYNNPTHWLCKFKIQFGLQLYYDHLHKSWLKIMLNLSFKYDQAIFF